MKYNITSDLKKIEDVQTPIQTSELKNEHYQPAIVIEACQTLDSSGNPSTPNTLKYIQSRQFRPYSIPDLPRLKSTINIRTFDSIEATTKADIDYINTKFGANIKSVENISGCTYVSGKSINGTKISSDSMWAKSLSIDEISSILGIIEELNVGKFSYTNAQFKELNSNNITGVTATFGSGGLTVSDVLTTDRLEFESLYRDLEYENETLNTKILRTDCTNFSINIPLKSNVIYPDKIASLVGVVGTTEVSVQSLELSPASTTNSNALGVIVSTDKSLVDNIFSSSTIAPIASIGKTKVKVASSQTNIIEKFDRLELAPSEPGCVKKHISTSTNKVIGIALETQVSIGADVNCIVLFDV